MQGLVTLNDTLRAVVGRSILGPETTAGLVHRPDGSTLVDAGLHLDELGERLDLALAEDEPPPYHTVAGLVMTQLGHVPRTGDTVQWQGLRLEVMDMDGNRVDKLLATRVPPPDPSSADSQEDG